jgi:hypothetical protein
LSIALDVQQFARQKDSCIQAMTAEGIMMGIFRSVTQNPMTSSYNIDGSIVEYSESSNNEWVPPSCGKGSLQLLAFTIIK